MENWTAKLIEKKLVVNSLNGMKTRNQDEENAEVKDENQFLESEEKILTQDENEKEKGELNGLEGDFNFSDAGEGKTDSKQGLVPRLQLSDQSPLVKIRAILYNKTVSKILRRFF